MNWNARSATMAIVLAALLASPGAAQAGAKPQSPTAAQLRDMIIEDSLTPAKMQLRNFVAELRDTLNKVQAIHNHISRNLSTGVTAVVLSDGHELGKRCRVSGATADLTARRIGTMYTNDPRGDQALSAYRAGLADLIDGLRACQHEDSLAMAVATPDLQRIERTAATAAAAVTRYDAIRDALMKLLNITLPVKGTIWQGGI